MQYNITYRQKDGGWQYIISFKEDGKWRQRSKQGYRTKRIAKKAADKRLERLKKENKNKEIITPGYEDITFEQYSSEFIEHKKIYEEQNTILIYKNVLEHFKDLDSMGLAKVTPFHIQKCVDHMTKEGLKPSTIKAYTSKLKTIFNHAINQHRIIAENPVQSIKIPEEKENNNKIKALTQVEFYDLLSKLNNQKEYISSFIAGACGLRGGEILGLTWDNIDFKNSTMTVSKQWKRLKNGEMGLGTVKTKNSNRTVPIPPRLLKELRKFKKNNPTDLNNRIIIYKSSNSLSGYMIQKYIKAGYDITIHDLRHTYATMLIANGVDFKTAAKLLGHDIKETMNTYSHVTDEMMDRATKTVNNVFK